MKDRKIYSYKNFMGLDKENKLLKVEPFRAADGHNFIIDSNTLKTRPAIRLNEIPDFFLYKGEKIIDWYEFRDLKIYITNKRFVFKYRDKFVFDHSEELFVKSEFTRLVSDNPGNKFLFDFEGLVPIFKEEKEALFIFGLDTVYVVAFFVDESDLFQYVFLYELSNKPIFNLHRPDTNAIQEYYDDLPTPYEPTIFIGNKRADDVNLLSNVSKYDFFSTQNIEEKDKEKIYHLPTHYDKEKHGDFESSVEFYKGLFGNLKRYPIFLGIDGEHFEGINQFGNVINEDEEIIMEDEFVSKNHFKYIRKSIETGYEDEVVSEITGLKKEDFFSLGVISNVKYRNVFEFLLEYINENYKSDTEKKNYILKFTLPIKVIKEIKEEETDFLIVEKQETVNKDVYVVLSKYENVNFYLGHEQSYTAEKITSEVISDVSSYVNDINNYPVNNSEWNGPEEPEEVTLSENIFEFDEGMDLNRILAQKIQTDLENEDLIETKVYLYDYEQRKGNEVSKIEENITDLVGGGALRNIYYKEPQYNQFPDYPSNPVVTNPSEYITNLAGNAIVQELDLFPFETDNPGVNQLNPNHLISFFESYVFDYLRDSQSFHDYIDRNNINENEDFQRKIITKARIVFKDIGNKVYVKSLIITWNFNFEIFNLQTKNMLLYNLNIENTENILSRSYEYDYHNGEIKEDLFPALPSLQDVSSYNGEYDIINEPFFFNKSPIFHDLNDMTYFFNIEKYYNEYGVNQGKTITEYLRSINASSGKKLLKIYAIEEKHEFYIYKSAYILWDYVKEEIVTDITMRTIVVFFKVQKDFSKEYEDIWSLKYNDKNNIFELKVRDFFYDYNNEPSIQVKIKFEKNPDFELIANSTFGINFGSEDRLFLAGNKDYPNIDRYNVSNDLLGDNVKHQSYELSYFPSKNYRVVGGKGAINGYVVAADNQLYITKEHHHNDANLFIRQRIIDDDGVLSYQEKKTNINKTPLNNRSVVRFYNDILMLTKDGLFGIEISSNVLTNERLIKLRSGFINNEIIEAIKEVDKEEVFVLENNHYMYMFIGKNIYVADSRYINSNPNSLIGNLSYEIVKWVTDIEFRKGIIKDELVLLDKEGLALYHLKNDNVDDRIIREEFSIFQEYFSDKLFFRLGGDYQYIFDDYKNYSIIFKEGYKLIAKHNEDFIVEGNEIIVYNTSIYKTISEGDELFSYENGIMKSFTIIEINDIDDRITFESSYAIENGDIYMDISYKPLYISAILKEQISGGVLNSFKLSPYKMFLEDEVPIFTSEADFNNRIDELTSEYDEYVFQDWDGALYLNKETRIEMKWLSGITDFGNNLMEKTMYRGNFYLSKQDKDNVLYFGYKTMRRMKGMGDRVGISVPLYVSQKINATDTFNFEEMGFKKFGLNTFQEFGMSLPLKENNFLYIQFIVIGYGQIEVNSMEFIYKNNRRLKTIG